MEAMHRASCGARATGIPRTTRSSKSRALPSHMPVSPEARQALSLGFMEASLHLWPLVIQPLAPILW